MIYPQTPEWKLGNYGERIGNYGVNLEPSSAVQFWRSVVLHHVEISQAKGVLPKDEMPNLIALR